MGTIPRALPRFLLPAMLLAASTIACNRSEERADWLLEKHQALQPAGQTGNEPRPLMVLLLLRERFLGQAAGRQAAGLLEDRAALALIQARRLAARPDWRILPATVHSTDRDRRDAGEPVLCFSPDSSQLAQFDPDDRLTVTTRGDSSPWALVGPADRSSPPSFSPDSRWLAFHTADHQPTVLDLQDGRISTISRCSSGPGGRLFFLPGSLLIEACPRQWRLLDPVYGRELLRQDLPPWNRAGEPDLDSQAQRLCYHLGGGEVAVFELEPVLENCRRWRTLAACCRKLPAPVDPPPGLIRQLDRQRLPRCRGMIRVAAEGRPFLIDSGAVGPEAVAAFRQAGGYSIPAWWPPEGLAYSLDREKSVPPAAPLNWYEAAALAAYLGKSLPSPQQWQAAHRSGAIPAPREEVWEWCRPELPPADEGYEEIETIFAFPLLSARTPGGRRLEPWLMPGYYAHATAVRCLVEEDE